MDFRPDFQGGAGQPVPAGPAPADLHHLRFRRRRSAAVHSGGHPRHRRLDQPAVCDLPESGAIPDGSPGQPGAGLALPASSSSSLWRVEQPPPGCRGRVDERWNAVSARQSVAEPARPLSFFEFWPGWLFYTPVVIHWLMLGVRYGDFSLPTAANPSITTGGLCGESKLSILGQVGPEAQALVAPACGVLARPDGVSAAEAAMAGFGLIIPSWSSLTSAATVTVSAW